MPPRKIAALAELYDELGLRRQTAWHYMHQEAAPPGTKISGGTATIWWRDEALEHASQAASPNYVTYLVDGVPGRVVNGAWKAWSPPPQGIVGLKEVVEATGRPRQKVAVWLHMPGAPRYVQLRCGPVYPNLREPVDWVAKGRFGTPGRPRHEPAKVAVDSLEPAPARKKLVLASPV